MNGVSQPQNLGLLGRYQMSALYQERGWHVLPLIDNDKRPIKKLSELPYRERLVTDEEALGFFQHSNNNVGIVTGSPSGIVVVDIDKPDMVEHYLSKYPTNCRASTPRGGMHLYYTYRGDDIHNSMSKLAEGIDVRADGGYVVAAPSMVEYDNGFIGVYKWVEFGTPSPLPTELQTLIKGAGGYTIDGQINKDDARDVAYKIFRDGFTSGQHNEQVKDLARYLVRHGLADTEVINIISALNAKDPTPQSQAQLMATLKSGIGYERNRLQSRPEKEDKGFDLIPITELFNRFGDDYNVDWLIDQWLPKNSLLALVAPPENYKTWLLLDVAITVALGVKCHPFLGEFKPEKQGYPVIVVQQEDYQGQVAQRIRTILIAKTEGIRYDFSAFETEDGITYSFDSPFLAPLHIHPDANLAFDNPDSIKGLERKIKETGAKLVVIDPLYTLDESDDYFMKLARKLKEFKTLRETYGVSFLIAHHTRKAGGDGRESMFGSNLLNGAFEGAWMVSNKEGNRLVERSGKFFTDKRKFILDMEIVTIPGQEVYKAEATDITDAVDTGYKNDRPVFDTIREYEKGIKQSDIAEELGIASKVVSDSLKRLVEKGYVIKAGRMYIVPKDIPFG